MKNSWIRISSINIVSTLIDPHHLIIINLTGDNYFHWKAELAPYSRLLPEKWSLAGAKAAISQPLNDSEMKNVTPTNPFTTWRHDSTRDWRVLKLPFLFLIREKVVKPERDGSIAIQKIYLILLKKLEYYRLYHKQNNTIIKCTKTVN